MINQASASAGVADRNAHSSAEGSSFQQRHVAAWATERIRNGTPVEWRVTADDVRIKLKRLYPTV